MEMFAILFGHLEYIMPIWYIHIMPIWYILWTLGE
jgi:hypothetical protein